MFDVIFSDMSQYSMRALDVDVEMDADLKGFWISKTFWVCNP